MNAVALTTAGSAPIETGNAIPADVKPTSTFFIAMRKIGAVLYVLFLPVITPFAAIFFLCGGFLIDGYWVKFFGTVTMLWNGDQQLNGNSEVAVEVGRCQDDETHNDWETEIQNRDVAVEPTTEIPVEVDETKAQAIATVATAAGGTPIAVGQGSNVGPNGDDADTGSANPPASEIQSAPEIPPASAIAQEDHADISQPVDSQTRLKNVTQTTAAEVVVLVGNPSNIANKGHQPVVVIPSPINCRRTPRTAAMLRYLFTPGRMFYSGTNPIAPTTPFSLPGAQTPQLPNLQLMLCYDGDAATTSRGAGKTAADFPVPGRDRALLSVRAYDYGRLAEINKKHNPDLIIDFCSHSCLSESALFESDSTGNEQMLYTKYESQDLKRTVLHALPPSRQATTEFYAHWCVEQICALKARKAVIVLCARAVTDVSTFQVKFGEELELQPQAECSDMRVFVTIGQPPEPAGEVRGQNGGATSALVRAISALSTGLKAVLIGATTWLVGVNH
ncbi:MAG: hypothetical protein LBB38_00130 [Puniceicoccales bacterium]|jgi:hypothetical protein|nr:hypothetical protein [Puniceicoccales bacterium]